jgi:hypothetical protein
LLQVERSLEKMESGEVGSEKEKGGCVEVAIDERMLRLVRRAVREVVREELSECARRFLGVFVESMSSWTEKSVKQSSVRKMKRKRNCEERSVSGSGTAVEGE